MQDVSKGEGRTVLFVSHNMSSIGMLCKHCVLLENGGLSMLGDTHDVINTYISRNHQINFKRIDNVVLMKGFRICDFTIEQNGESSDELEQGMPFAVSFEAISELDFDVDLTFNFEVNTEGGLYRVLEMNFRIIPSE